VSAVGMGFLSIASSLLNIALDDWKSPQNDVVILSGRNSHPRLRHFLDESGRVTLADCFWVLLFRTKTMISEIRGVSWSIWIKWPCV
jgi:hypothetical protein